MVYKKIMGIPVRSRCRIISLFAGLFLIAYMNDAVPQACATMQTDNNAQVMLQSGTLNWVWTGTGTFNLNQNSNGLISGNLGDPNCNPGSNDFYDTTGSINASGGFSLASTYHGNTAGCASTLSMSGTLRGAGCTMAEGSWSNSGGLGGSFTMTHGCFVPTGEANQAFEGFQSRTQGGGVYEVAVFQMQVAPLIFNWGGRTVSETFPQPAVDGCWFPGSLAPQVITPAASNSPIDSSGIYGDAIGPVADAVQYYREKGRTPCTITTQQVLVIDCPNPPENPTYFTVTQIDAIGPRLLTVTRGNNPSVSEAFGAPAPALTLPAWLFNLLFPPQ
jgi:hypothetical protein